MPASEQQVSTKAQLLAHVSESEFQQAIVDAAHASGWLVYHTYDSRRSEPGFPDLVLIRGAELLVVEVKRETGKTTPAQEQWLEAFGAVHRVTAKVIRPSGWDDLVRFLRSPVNGCVEVRD